MEGFHTVFHVDSAEVYHMSWSELQGRCHILQQS
jgi:hypothetical protein